MSFNAADAISGLASVSPAITITTEGANQIVNGTARDSAGNTSVVACKVNIDKTPPEANLQFDPATKDLLLFGRDSLSGVPTGPVAPTLSTPTTKDGGEKADDDQGDHASQVRTYQVQDLAGNFLVVVANFKKQEDGLDASVTSLQYGSASAIPAPKNSEHAAWDGEDGQLNELQQTVDIGTGKDRQEVQAEFHAKKNETHIEAHTSAGEKESTVTGMVLLRTATNVGSLAVEY